ncbi:uncharacterized protein LOC144905301 [Branchiostoma floridae x Branchiostoma belcheri]
MAQVATMPLVRVFLLSVVLNAAAGLNLNMLGRDVEITTQPPDPATTIEQQQPTAQMEGVGGTTYIRWGKTTCPRSASLVYDGMAAGAHYAHAGGGANYLCLPKDPEWGSHQDAFNGNVAYLYGAEYETHNQPPFVGAGLHDHDVPCAVCHAPGRSALLMIPGRKTCKGDGWVSEYSGYLMASHYSHPRTEWVCLDSEPEKGGTPVNHNGVLFYPVEGRCGSLECPPYVDGREITCVVCTK